MEIVNGSWNVTMWQCSPHASGDNKRGTITYRWRSSCNASVAPHDFDSPRTGRHRGPGRESLVMVPAVPWPRVPWRASSLVSLQGCKPLSQGKMVQDFGSKASTFVIVLSQRDDIRWGYQGSSQPWNNSGLPEEEPHDTLCTHIFKVSFTKKKKVRNVSLKGWLSPEQRVVKSRFLLQPLPWSQQTPYYALDSNSHSWEQSSEKK